MSEENVNCPYLIYKTSKSCVSCTGYRCTSAGREKKIDEKQLDTCRDINEYVLCTRYIETLPKQLEEAEPYEEEPAPEPETSPQTLVPATETIEEPITPAVKPNTPCGCGHPDVRESSCPYQGPPPEGASSCLGIWCYAANKNIRVDKNCVNHEICTVFLMNKYKGVPYYNA